MTCHHLTATSVEKINAKREQLHKLVNLIFDQIKHLSAENMQRNSSDGLMQSEELWMS